MNISAARCRPRRGAAVRDSRERLSEWLAELMRWDNAHGILTFVCNFLLPQQNPMGRLLPRYDLRNFVHFVEKLNEALAEEVKRYNNAYFFDLDQILSTYGRRYFQDDAVGTIAHGAALSDGDWEEDGGRLSGSRQVSSYYPLSTYDFVLHVWTELIGIPDDPANRHGQAGTRRSRRHDVAKRRRRRGGRIEHGARGLAARLCRGADVSEAARGSARHRVEERRGAVRGIWQRICGDLVRLEDFAVRKINWQPKADNIEAIRGGEPAAEERRVHRRQPGRTGRDQGFPGHSSTGPNPYLWRRILLWARKHRSPRLPPNPQRVPKWCRSRSSGKVSAGASAALNSWLP
jgi:hypothetical protein